MFNKITVLLLVSLVTALLVTGCIDTRREFTINPDGSGKVKIDSRFDLQEIRYSGKKMTDEQALNQQVGQIIQHSQGVSAWKDVAYKLEDDDVTVHFSGTAYFNDINKLMLYYNFSALSVKFEGSAENKTLKIGVGNKGLAAATDTKPLTDEENSRMIKRAKAKFLKQKTAVLAMVQGINIIFL